MGLQLQLLVQLLQAIALQQPEGNATQHSPVCPNRRQGSRTKMQEYVVQALDGLDENPTAGIDRVQKEHVLTSFLLAEYTHTRLRLTRIFDGYYSYIYPSKAGHGPDPNDQAPPVTAPREIIHILGWFSRVEFVVVHGAEPESSRPRATVVPLYYRRSSVCLVNLCRWK